MARVCRVGTQAQHVAAETPQATKELAPVPVVRAQHRRRPSTMSAALW